MRKVEMFETEDGKLFAKENEAVVHEWLLVKVAKIVALFGKQPDNEDYVIVPEVKSSMKVNVRYNHPYFVDNNTGEGKEVPFEA